MLNGRIFVIANVCLILCLCLIGCAKTVYTHPTKPASEFDRDKYDCEKVAEQSAANTGSSMNPFYIVSEMKRCLVYKHGWVPQQ
jgi:hypothetical protein